MSLVFLQTPASLGHQRIKFFEVGSGNVLNLALPLFFEKRRAFRNPHVIWRRISNPRDKVLPAKLAQPLLCNFFYLIQLRLCRNRDRSLFFCVMLLRRVFKMRSAAFQAGTALACAKFHWIQQVKHYFWKLKSQRKYLLRRLLRRLAETCVNKKANLFCLFFSHKDFACLFFLSANFVAYQKYLRQENIAKMRTWP